MGPREPRSAGLAAILFLVAVIAVPAAPASANHECYYDPELRRLVCEDHGGGGGGGGSSNSYWTSWQLVGQCGGGGSIGGGVIVDLNTKLVLALRDHIVNGEVVDTQSECIDLEESEYVIWDEIVTAIETLSAPRWESNPDSSLSAGLTGLETWLWYSNPSQVGPIEAIWVEPVTGIEFGVRGRGWTESITWNTGEASYEVFAVVWDDAPAMGGSPDAPAARHVYNTTSTAAGYSSGYPVSLDLLWVGEYQVRVIDGVWASCNTVKLDAEDGGDGWSGGLGPVGVSGPFDVPFGHFAFDESGVGSEPSFRVEPLAELGDGVGPGSVSGVRGKNRALVRWSGVRCGGRRRS